MNRDPGDENDARTVPLPTPTYRLWVNPSRTVLFRLWSNGMAEVSTREREGWVWGPPVPMSEERT